MNSCFADAGPTTRTESMPSSLSRDIVKETPRIVGVLARFAAAFRMAVNMVLR